MRQGVLTLFFLSGILKQDICGTGKKGMPGGEEKRD